MNKQGEGPFLKWTKSLDIGFRAVDSDHHLIVDGVNSLHSRVQRGAPEDELRESLESLIQNIEDHFEREESFMYQCGYSYFAEHVLEHHRYLDALRAVKGRFEEDPKMLAGTDTLEFLRHWTIHHIETWDRSYIPYMKGEKRPDDAIDRKEQPLRNVTVRVPLQSVDHLHRFAAILRGGGDRSKHVLDALYEKYWASSKDIDLKK